MNCWMRFCCVCWRIFHGPVAIGLRSGHVLERNITVPIGVESELDLTNAPTLRFQPSVVCKQGSR